MPSEMQKRHPDLWKNDDEEGGKMFEEQFASAITTLGKRRIKIILS